MSKVIWFFGASATGKKTLMCKMANTDKIHPFRYELGISIRDTVIPVIIPYPFRMPEKRKAIIDGLYQSDLPVVFLVHGQDKDLDNGFVPRGGTCVYMDIPNELHWKRIKKRGLRKNLKSAVRAWKTGRLGQLTELFDEIIAYNG